MANTRTISATLQKEGLPLELVRAPEGYHYFIWDTLDSGAANRAYETHSIMVPRFGDQTPERWLEDGRAFARELEQKGLWPLEAVEPPPPPPSISEIAEREGFDILLERRDQLLEKLEKLAKKAKRYGAEGISWTVSEPFEKVERRTMWDGSVRKVRRTYINVKVSGPAPRVGAFTFLARIEHTKAGNLVDLVPGQELPDLRFRTAAPHCDHCSTARDRKETFLVRHESGTLAQVGRSCLRDYMGTDNPAHIAWRFQWEREAREMLWDEEREGRGGKLYFSTLEVVALTLAAVRLWGWCSKGQAQNTEDLTPTIKYVEAVLYAETNPKTGKPTEDRARLEAELKPEDWEEARRVLDWAKDGGAGSGDYAHNLAVLCATDEVEPKRGGFVASAVSAKARADEAELRRTREREDAKDRQWIGAPGDRLKGLELTFDSQRTVGGGYYGNTYLMKFRDASGNVLTWFSSVCFSLRPGEKVKLDGTVKAHNEYNGAKETVLTRCKIMCEENA